MGVGKEFKRARGKESQQQLSLELNVSREAVSSYETERARMPKDVSLKVMNKYDDPDLARALANEYTGGAWAPALDGPAMIRQCSAIQSRTMKETEEAYHAIQKAVLDINPQYLGNFEREDIKKSLDEASEAIAFLNEYMATVCKTYKISWLKTWTGCQARLIHRGFMRMVGGKKK
ncbi:helix-turn-helix transcriptional regulator [Sporolactobacillus sp. CQH2019]|uniref:helix-turn-helix domain-containing protein n=1 Tax=Sporolactobacillus sp. CQH2019 TaxID=3023512 RepID=UPI0023678D9F|nr:helix-turn-helix transcriptional regulator [Sporolactobacillus sp. CQH2019]MDD9147855.1 helix-turn-helix transcriptional regulator [Sporolactobacillus sp. CQH2019]